MSLLGNNPEVEGQLNASETMGRRVHIIDGALKGLEQTPQLSELTQNTPVVKNEIERLRQLRQQEAATLNSEVQRLADGQISYTDSVVDMDQFREDLEIQRQNAQNTANRQQELARRDIRNSEERAA